MTTVGLPTPPHEGAATEKATGVVALVMRHGTVEALLAHPHTTPGHSRPVVDGALPEGAFVAEDLDELVHDAPGSGYVMGRVSARVENGEIVEIIGTFDHNPPAIAPTDALEVAATLGLPLGSVAHTPLEGGRFSRTHYGAVCVAPHVGRYMWEIDTSPRWQLIGRQ